jgi:hypothetical protein
VVAIGFRNRKKRGPKAPLYFALPGSISVLALPPKVPIIGVTPFSHGARILLDTGKLIGSSEVKDLPMSFFELVSL